MPSLDKLDVRGVVTFHGATDPNLFTKLVDEFKKQFLFSISRPQVRGATVSIAFRAAGSAMKASAVSRFETGRYSLTVVIAKAAQDGPIDSACIRAMAELCERMNQFFGHALYGVGADAGHAEPPRRGIVLPSEITGTVSPYV